MANLPGMKISLVVRASILAVMMVGWMAAPALAAPSMLSSDPEEGAEMHAPPGEVTVEFSEPLQDSSGLTVEDGCGNKVSEGPGRIVGTAGNELNVVIDDAPYRGTYTASYVATGVTGTTTGSFTFIVHGGANCDGSGGGGGGNHGGHGGGNGGGGNDGGGNNHGGHDGSGDGDGSGGNHSGGDHDGGSDHDGMGTSSGDHAGMSQHGEHQDMNHDRNREHKNKKHGNGKHGNGKHGGKHGEGRHGGGGNPPIAAPTDPTGATDIPTGSTVIVALGLAVLMGLIGGWVLRVSTPN